MSDEESDPARDEASLLAEMKALRRRARTERHAYWFPLVLFGLLTCASVPFYVLPAEPARRAPERHREDPRCPSSADIPASRFGATWATTGWPR